MISIALVVALSSVPSSLARLDALKAEEKAIKKDLKAKGIILKGKKAYRLVPLEKSNVPLHDLPTPKGVSVPQR